MNRSGTLNHGMRKIAESKIKFIHYHKRKHWLTICKFYLLYFHTPKSRKLDEEKTRIICFCLNAEIYASLVLTYFPEICLSCVNILVKMFFPFYFGKYLDCGDIERYIEHSSDWPFDWIAKHRNGKHLFLLFCCIKGHQKI